MVSLSRPTRRQERRSAPTREEAQAIAHSRAVRFLALVLPAAVWRNHGRDHPLGLERAGSTCYWRTTTGPRWSPRSTPSVPDELLPQQFCGTPAEIAEQLRCFADAGMRHVSLMFVSALYSQRAAIYSSRAAHHIARALN